MQNTFSNRSAGEQSNCAFPKRSALVQQRAVIEYRRIEGYINLSLMLHADIDLSDL